MAHAAVALEFRYDPAGGGLDRPRRVEAVLTLRPDGSGLLARPLQRGDVDIAPVDWRRAGDHLELDPGKIGTEGRTGLLAWETWSLELDDADGDGVLDSGSGTASGQWDQTLGDVMDFARWEAEIETTPDTAAPVARLAFPDDMRPFPIDDRVLVSFSEPVAWEEDAVRIRVDGRPEPARASPVDLVQGHAIRALLQLDRLAPFTAALALEAPLADPAGHTARWDGDTLKTPADPGSIGSDIDFEEALTGWIAEGPVSVVDFHPSGDPGRRARVASGGRLTGVLDVPDDALTLEIGIEVLSQIGHYEAGVSAVIDLVAPGSRTRVFDVSVTKASGSPYGTTSGPLEISASLKELRGQRALLSFAAGSGYMGTEHAILVRSVRVSRVAGAGTRSDAGTPMGAVMAEDPSAILIEILHPDSGESGFLEGRVGASGRRLRGVIRYQNVVIGTWTAVRESRAATPTPPPR